jgi:hypothetical protein
MDKKSKVLIFGIGVLLILSIGATFYKTVILQDLDVTGVWIEFPTEETSYIWFFYDNEEYEIELDTTNRDNILSEVASEVQTTKAGLDAQFVAQFDDAFDLASNNSNNQEDLPANKENLNE